MPVQGDKILFENGDLREVTSRENDDTVFCGDVLLNLKGESGDMASFLTTHANNVSKGSTQYAINQAFGNPNCLLNPDFLVNQKGQTSYTSPGETVDCWVLTGQGSVTKNGDNTYIGGLNFGFGQTMRHAQALFGKTYTLSFCIGDEIYFATQQILAQSGDYCIKSLANAGIKGCVRVASDLSASVVFEGATSSQVAIKWVKLEEGNSPTKHFVTDPYVEQLKIKAQSLCNVSVVQEGDVLKITL